MERWMREREGDLLAHIEDEYRSRTGAFEEMAHDEELKAYKHDWYQKNAERLKMKPTGYVLKGTALDRIEPLDPESVHRNGRFIDRSGQRFGRLLVVAFAGRYSSPSGKKRAYVWECQCDCGNRTFVVVSALTCGHTTSCGCFNREQTRNSPGRYRKAEGVAAFNQLLAAYKKAARERHLPFELSSDQFRTLTQENCFYCGLPPSLRASTVKATYGEYIYTGIDRIDNFKGYTLDNVRPCCKQCNRAKMDISEQEFFDWIQRLVKHSNECKRGDL